MSRWISNNPPNPTAVAASGVWSLSEQFVYKKSGIWPNVVGSILFGNGLDLGDDWLQSYVYWGESGVNDPSSDRSFGTGNFTMECWIRPTATGTFQQNIYCSGNGNNGLNILFYFTSTSLNLATMGTTDGVNYSVICSRSTTFSVDQWYHVAACRSGGTLRLFVNGTQLGASVSDSTNWISKGSSYCALLPQTNVFTYISVNGKNYNIAKFPYRGYMSNLRLVAGTALYTTNFTPSTVPLTAISGTTLLCFQGYGLSDKSTFNHGPDQSLGVSFSSLIPFV